MHLDKTKPFGHVYGIPGVAFEQDGKYFRTNGEPADTQPEHENTKRPTLRLPKNQGGQHVAS